MDTEAFSIEELCCHYSDILSESIDILLLSMGCDGYIASLFPNGRALFEIEKKVVPVSDSKVPHRRLTITPRVVKAAKQVYVLAVGDDKRRKYEEALLYPDDINLIPARLVLDKTWIFDFDGGIGVCPKF